ncbi:hypothetical protein BCR35DRAFT_110890 [Leucosporidium creatinivorum]|uniref:Uncharacterized protein n=1 Tax=Leucosporidium creatinivorum TaxID=106004 RepID=A0A1Y2F2E3_9BASI|nr:hypothetical protein BCR35DRAFT_110890 [Leucosporidium creatinivorum]
MTQNARLHAVIAQLQTSLDEERALAVDEDAELVALLSAKLAARSSRRAETFDRTYAAASGAVDEVARSRQAQVEMRSEQFGEMEERNEWLAEAMKGRLGEVEQRGEEGKTALAGSLEGVRNEVEVYQTAVRTIGKEQIEVVRRNGAELESGGATCEFLAASPRYRPLTSLPSQSAATLPLPSRCSPSKLTTSLPRHVKASSRASTSSATCSPTSTALRASFAASSIPTRSPQRPSSRPPPPISQPSAPTLSPTSPPTSVTTYQQAKHLASGLTRKTRYSPSTSISMESGAASWIVFEQRRCREVWKSRWWRYRLRWSWR